MTLWVVSKMDLNTTPKMRGQAVTTDGLRPLPEGWVWTMIGQVTLPVEKVSPEQKPDVPFVYIDISSIDNSIQKIVEPKEYLGSEAPSRARQLVRANDVVFSTVRTYLKNVALVPDIYDKQIASTGFSVLRASDAVQSKFLFYFTLTDEFLSPLNELQRGTSYPAVRDGDVRVQPFPLPPLPEQERIVARLEELLSDLEAGVTALERVRAGVKRYKASVLKAACEGKLFGDRGIEDGELLEEGRWVTVGDVTESMKNGVYKPAEYYADDGIACLRMYNIEDGAIVWKDIKRMKLTEEEVETYRLLPGDILVNRVNSRELVGKTAVIPSGLESIVYESKNIRLKIKQDIADSTYINYCFGAYRQRYFNFNAQQVVGMASINQTQIAQMPIPLPPLEEQLRIVVEVERRLESARAVESAVEVGLKRAGRLRQAVLRSAFEGRL